MLISSKLLQMIAAFDDNTLRRATYYDSPSFTMKVTRQRPYSKRDRTQTFIVTCGSPNYAEREFIKLCKKAKQGFPVNKIQLKAWPKKKPR